MVWEHEVYNNFDYNAPKPFLHWFEGEVKHLVKLSLPFQLTVISILIVFNNSKEIFFGHC